MKAPNTMHAAVYMMMVFLFALPAGASSAEIVQTNQAVSRLSNQAVLQDLKVPEESFVSNMINKNERVISLTVNDLPLFDALKELASKARVGLSYHSDIQIDRRVSMDMKNVPV